MIRNSRSSAEFQASLTNPEEKRNPMFVHFYPSLSSPPFKRVASSLGFGPGFLLLRREACRFFFLLGLGGEPLRFHRYQKKSISSTWKQGCAGEKRSLLTLETPQTPFPLTPKGVSKGRDCDQQQCLGPLREGAAEPTEEVGVPLQVPLQPPTPSRRPAAGAHTG